MTSPTDSGPPADARRELAALLADHQLIDRAVAEARADAARLQPETTMALTLADLRRNRPQILALARRYRVQNVRVFGSVVRGDLEPWSDVDFIVEPLPDHSLLDRAGLVVALEELLGTRVDVAAAGELREFLRDRVEAEAVAL